MSNKTYSIIARCSNCGHEWTENITYGEEITGRYKCDNCGCHKGEQKLEPIRKPIDEKTL